MPPRRPAAARAPSPADQRHTAATSASRSPPRPSSPWLPARKNAQLGLVKTDQAQLASIMRRHLPRHRLRALASLALGAALLWLLAPTAIGGHVSYLTTSGTSMKP